MTDKVQVDSDYFEEIKLMASAMRLHSDRQQRKSNQTHNVLRNSTDLVVELNDIDDNK